jgi:ribosome biogenesis GTPase
MADRERRVTLESLGYSDWYREALNQRDADEACLARIVAVDRDRYVIAGPIGAVPAEATGKLLYCADSQEDMPCVGDWVIVDYLDSQEHAIIHDILPRKTILRRRAAGGKATYQPIAANIDVAYIVQSCDVDFNMNRLDRYIVMAKDGGIVPRLLLTKCDIVAGTGVEPLVEEAEKGRGIEATAISSVTGAGYEKLTRALQKGMTYCLLGSSGVGKSTILNRLLGGGELAVGSVREKSGKGRHTTTRRQLVSLENGALFVDTPGMRELGMMAFETGLGESFPDIAAASESCRYADCTHTVEEGCAILAKVASGHIATERYQSYLKLFNESKRYEMTNLEKRRKDKAFGKMLKNYKKFNKKR